MEFNISNFSYGHKIEEKISESSSGACPFGKLKLEVAVQC